MSDRELTKEQRAIAAAHLGDLGCIAFRVGKFRIGQALARGSYFVATRERLDHEYRVALDLAGLTAADIDEAVASVLRGEHPAGSLPRRVTKMREDAYDDKYRRETGEAEGEVYALGAVLEMLGVKTEGGT